MGSIVCWKNYDLTAVQLLMKNNQAKVIYDGQAWAFFDVKKPIRDFPLKVEKIIHKIKTLVSKKYKQAFSHNNFLLSEIKSTYSKKIKEIETENLFYEAYFTKFQEIQRLEAGISAIQSDIDTLNNKFHSDVKQHYKVSKDDLNEIHSKILAKERDINNLPLEEDDLKKIERVVNYKDRTPLIKSKPIFGTYFSYKTEIQSELAKISPENSKKEGKTGKFCKDKNFFESKKLLLTNFLNEQAQHSKNIASKEGEIKALKNNALLMQKDHLVQAFHDHIAKFENLKKYNSFTEVTKDTYKALVQTYVRLSYFNETQIPIEATQISSLSHEAFNWHKVITTAMNNWKKSSGKS